MIQGALINTEKYMKRGTECFLGKVVENRKA